MLLLINYPFFFFQAEDGIRDDLVTGVQTCALPISICSAAMAAPESRAVFGGDRSVAVRVKTVPTVARIVAAVKPATKPMVKTRSEERRVGKECRSRW